MKKYFSLFLVLALMLSVLAGCGDSSSTAQSSASEAQSADEQAASSASAAEAVTEDTEAAEAVNTEVSFPLCEETETISMWLPEPSIIQGILSPDEMGIYDLVRDLTNVEIAFDIVTTESASEKFNLMVTSGDYSDIIYNFGRYYTGSLEYAIEEDIIQDLTDYAEEYLPNYYAALTLTDDRLLSNTTANGYIAGKSNSSSSSQSLRMTRPLAISDVSSSAAS